MREIIFDTETTGFRPDEGHRMVEIGCIEMINRTETGNSYHCYFNPQRDMPLEAENIHGLSANFLSDKPLFADRADELLAFLGDAPLVAHNAAFDFRFLNAELEAAGRMAISLDRMVDTVVMARAKFPGSPASLDALCSRFGVDRSHRVKHGALLDAELLAQVYIELTGGRQIGLSLVSDEHVGVSNDDQQSASHRDFVARVAQNPRRTPRPHSANAEELLLHAEFLKTVKEPLWHNQR